MVKFDLLIWKQNTFLKLNIIKNGALLSIHHHSVHIVYKQRYSAAIISFSFSKNTETDI